jgi:hypothetical protein
VCENRQHFLDILNLGRENIHFPRDVERLGRVCLQVRLHLLNLGRVQRFVSNIRRMRTNTSFRACRGGDLIGANGRKNDGIGLIGRSRSGLNVS